MNPWLSENPVTNSRKRGRRPLWASSFHICAHAQKMLLLFRLQPLVFVHSAHCGVMQAAADGLCNHYDPCSHAEGPLPSRPRNSPQTFDENPFIPRDTSINLRHLQDKAVYHPRAPTLGMFCGISALPDPHPTCQRHGDQIESSLVKRPGLRCYPLAAPRQTLLPSPYLASSEDLGS